jgi:hypothetical protein
MTVDADGVLRDQNGDIGCVDLETGAIDFVPEADITDQYLTGPWSSNSSDNAAIELGGGYTAYGCDNTTASAYQMFMFTASPTAMPSCTDVLLQV